MSFFSVNGNILKVYTFFKQMNWEPHQIDNIEIQQYNHKLFHWKSEPHQKTLHNVLVKIYTKVRINQTENDLNSLLSNLRQFHREANKTSKSNKQIVSEEWFPEIIKAKEHISNLLEQKKKKSKNNDKTFKQNFDSIIVPPKLMENKHPHYQMVMELLYKNFVTHLKQSAVAEQTKIIAFLERLIAQLFDQFNFGKEVANHDQKNTQKLMATLKELSHLFSDRSRLINKLQMLDGQIDPKSVAKCDPLSFFPDEARRLRKKREMSENSVSHPQ